VSSAATKPIRAARIRHAVRSGPAIGLLLLLCFGLIGAAQAVGSERFLERLSSESSDGRLVVTIHFIRRVQLLSHVPAKYGERLEIRLRGRGATAAQLPGMVLGEGLRQLTPTRLPQIRKVTASGNLDSDPAVIVWFDRARGFRVRAGRNDRSIDIVLEPDAPGVAVPDAEPLPAPAQPRQDGMPGEREMPNLFRQARLAFNEGRYQRATAIYDKIIASGLEPYVREAIVALGVARALRGQDAHARAQFQRYLKDYPDGPEARRVKRLLDALLARRPSSADAVAEAPEEAQPWQVFGTFDQFYLLNHSKIEGRDSDTLRSSLLSSTNVNFQGRAGSFDLGGRFSGSYDYSFLSERSSLSRVSYAYLDLASTDGTHEARLGRQRLPGSGVLGYFDGLHYQYQLNDRNAVRYAVGSPMRSTRDGVDSDRVFNGLALDFNGADDRWFLSLYGLYQSFDGELDRRALGVESRYLGDSITAYSLVDYDTYFDKLNIFYLFGSWRVQEGTVASLTLDERRTPGLSLSNAVYSLGADDFSDLDPLLPDGDLKSLAKDLSLVYRSAYASLTQQLDKRWQLQFDGGISSLRDDSDQPEISGLDSDDWYVYGQLMGSGLIKSGDLFSVGLRYTDAERADITSLLLRARAPVNERLQIDPRLRLDLRDGDDGDDRRRLIPSLFTTYRLSKRTSLELDLGLEFSRTEFDMGDKQDDRFFYLSAGYRHDF